MDTRQLARVFFGVDLPISSVGLKRAFRQKCFELHPDIGGDASDFSAMQQAYEAICADAAAFTSADLPTTLTATDGTPLSELGKGLGAENGTDCPDCHHDGYQAITTRSVCKRCLGDGVITKHVTRPPGKGWGGPVVEFHCHVCNGWGRMLEEVTAYARCWRCDGKGEIPMWNPALRKAAMGGQR